MHRPRGNTATLIATAALFLALGGGAFAANKLINGASIRPHTITLRQLSSHAVKQLRGGRGPTGATGPAGPAGTVSAAPTLTATSLGLTTVQQTFSLPAAPDTNHPQQNGADVTCPDGQVAIGGGLSEESGPFVLSEDGPYYVNSSQTPTGWIIDASNSTTTALTGTLSVICINQ